MKAPTTYIRDKQKKAVLCDLNIYAKIDVNEAANPKYINIAKKPLPKLNRWFSKKAYTASTKDERLAAMVVSLKQWSGVGSSNIFIPLLNFLYPQKENDPQNNYDQNRHQWKKISKDRVWLCCNRRSSNEQKDHYLYHSEYQNQNAEDGSSW